MFVLFGSGIDKGGEKQMKKSIPMPVNLGDLVLLGQMGYEIPYADGLPMHIDKPGRMKRALELFKGKIKSR